MPRSRLHRNFATGLKMYNGKLGKNVLLTGATGGIGRELAKKFVTLGYNIFLTSTNEDNLVALKDQIRPANSRVKIEYFPAFLDNEREIDSLISSVRKSFKKIDILVNCAGVFEVNTLSEVTRQSYRKSFDVNVMAPFLLSQEFSKDMIKSKKGKIVNIGSSSSYAGFAATSVYCSTKHALLGLSRSLYEELKPHNIKVYCFSPGSVQTEMGKNVPNQDYNTFIRSDELADFIVSSVVKDSNMISQEVRINRFQT